MRSRNSIVECFIILPLGDLSAVEYPTDLSGCLLAISRPPRLPSADSARARHRAPRSSTEECFIILPLGDLQDTQFPL